MTSPTPSAAPPPSPIPHPSAPCPFLPALPAPAVPETPSAPHRWLVYLRQFSAWGWFAAGPNQWLPTDINDSERYTDADRESLSIPDKAEWVEVGSRRYYAVSVAILSTELRSLANTVLELGNKGEVAADADLAFGSLMATATENLDKLDFDHLIQRVAASVDAAVAKHRKG